MTEFIEQSVKVEEGVFEKKGSTSVAVSHGTDTYRVVAEKHKYLIVYPEREMPDHPGRRYPWPIGIPWLHTAASHAVCLYRTENGIF
jgi:hypothetical protein